MTLKGRRTLERENGELNTQLEMHRVMTDQLKTNNMALVGHIELLCSVNPIKGFIEFIKLRRMYSKNKKQKVEDKDN